ncbi:MAG: hypothetical protein JWM11_8114, partial [Planctomycetaceae bacterium]|nr:hypothetical protein [Planctomycetaceae bacterium]
MTTDASEGTFRIAIYNQHRDPHVLSTVFQKVLQVHPTDAITWSRHVPGILNARFSEQQSAALVTAITAAGLFAQAVRDDEIPDLHQSLAVHHLQLDENGLQIIELHG